MRNLSRRNLLGLFPSIFAIPLVIKSLDHIEEPKEIKCSDEICYDNHGNITGIRIFNHGFSYTTPAILITT